MVFKFMVHNNIIYLIIPFGLLISLGGESFAGCQHEYQDS